MKVPISKVVLILLVFSYSVKGQDESWILGRSIFNENSTVNPPKSNFLKFFDINFKSDEITANERSLGESINSIISGGIGETMSNAVNEYGEGVFYCFVNPTNGLSANFKDTLFIASIDEATGKDEIFYKIETTGNGASSVKNIEIVSDIVDANIFHLFYKSSALNTSILNDIVYLKIDARLRKVLTSSIIDSNNINEGMALSTLNCKGERALFYTKNLQEKIQIFSILIDRNGLSTPNFVYEISNVEMTSGGQGGLEISPDGKILALSNFTVSKNIQNDLYLLDLDIDRFSLSNIREINNPLGPIFSLEFSPNSKRLYIGVSGATGISNTIYNIESPINNYTLTANDRLNYSIGPGLLNLQLSKSGKLVFSNGFYNSEICFISNPNTDAQSNLISCSNNNLFGAMIGVTPAFPDQIDGLDREPTQDFEIYASLDTVCLGESVSLTTSLDNQDVIWYYNLGLIDTAVQIDIIPAFQESVSALFTDSTGCEDGAIIDLVVKGSDTLAFDFKYDQCSKTLSLTNESSTNLGIGWFLDGELLSQDENIAIPLNDGSFNIGLITNYQTRCQDSIFETVEIVTEELDDFVGNANIFSPNDDDVNDLFCINYSSDLIILNFELLIFDRWGNLVFQTDSIEHCWEGDFNGEKCEVGVYTYLLKYQASSCFDANQTKYGTITLIR